MRNIIVSSSKSSSLFQILRRSSFSSPSRQIIRSHSSKSVSQSNDVSTVDASNADIHTPDVPQALGFGGVLPFLGGAFATTLFPESQFVARATQIYGASILSFLGGVHWGIALKHPSAISSSTPSSSTLLSTVFKAPDRDFIVSVIPSLVGWAAAVAPPHPGLAVLSSSFVALYVYDRFRIVSLKPIPSWYLPLRLPLTVAAAGGCAVAWFAVRRHGLKDESEENTSSVSSSPIQKIESDSVKVINN